ncbi:ABC transporter ATP-binding protein [Phycicoccus jejuensis]
MTNSARATGARIDISHLTKTYGSQRAVDDVSVSVEPGEFMTLLGPSGSGKTTTLNLIAGFNTPDEGSIHVNGRDVGHLPPHKRNLGVVFQNYALFPHLSVSDNVAFPLKQRRVSSSERKKQVAQALETVHLHGMADRRPSQLSGGQQQRVALARSIVFKPSVLLMDEPLGALDRKLRDSMQLEVRRIHREVGSTVIFVTHDQEEALALSDRIAVFRDGRIEQIGTGRELYESPASIFIATFLGESTLIAGKVRSDGRGSFVEGAAKVRVNGSLPDGSAGVVMVRPERLRLEAAGAVSATAEQNAVEVTVLNEMYLGSSRRLGVRLPDGTTGLVREPASTASAVRAGDRAVLRWPVNDGVLLVADPAAEAVSASPAFQEGHVAPGRSAG